MYPSTIISHLFLFVALLLYTTSATTIITNPLYSDSNAISIQNPAASSSTGTSRLINPFSSWTTVNNGASFTAREGHCSIYFNNVLIVAGGRSLTGVLNDVWSSKSGGAQWTKLGTAPWKARGGLACTVVNGLLIIVGGADGLTTYNDVWSTSDGITWTQQSSNNQFSPRQYAGLQSIGSTLVLMGGENGMKYLRDIWISTNNGITWKQQLIAAPWSARSRFTTVMIDSTIYLTGGERQGFGTLNDAWSSSDSGKTWMLQSLALSWRARRGHGMTRTDDGTLILAGGQASNGLFLSDVWTSTNNGVTWLLAEQGQFSARAYFGLVHIGNCIFIVGGLTPTCAVNDIYISGSVCGTGTGGTKISGDPEFSGFLGQQFQVHGVPDWIYNIISYNTMQLNTRFKFFGTGRSTLNTLDTLPELTTKSWTHPGNYMGDMGIKLHSQRLYVKPGSWEHGFKLVTVDNKKLSISSRLIPIGIQDDQNELTQYIVYRNTHEIEIHTALLHIVLVNADHFINVQEVNIHNFDHSTIRELHGLLGHTADKALYTHMLTSKQKYPVGELDDYALSETDDLFSDSFTNNRFTWTDQKMAVDSMHESDN